MSAMEGLMQGLIGGIGSGASAMANIYKDERQNAAKIENETQLAEARAQIEEERAKRIADYNETKRREGKAADLKFDKENAGLINQMTADKANAADVGAPLRNEQIKEFKSKAEEQRAKNEWEKKYETAKPGSQEESALHRSGIIHGWIKAEQDTETVTSIERDEAGNETGRVVSKRPRKKTSLDDLFPRKEKPSGATGSW